MFGNLALEEDVKRLKADVAILSDRVEELEKSVNALLDAKAAAPEDEEEIQLRTPRPKTLTERRNLYIASRKDPQFIEKVIGSKRPKQP